MVSLGHNVVYMQPHLDDLPNNAQMTCPSSLLCDSLLTLGLAGNGHSCGHVPLPPSHSCVIPLSPWSGQVTAIDVDATKAGEAVKDLSASEFVTFAEATGEGPNSKKSEFDVILNTASGQIDTAKLMDMLKPDGTLIQVRESLVCGVINLIRICMHACVRAYGGMYMHGFVRIPLVCA